MPEIDGGYILLARKMMESEIMKKPPLHLKLWVWMLNQATRQDLRNGLKRGQFFTNTSEMRDAMSWYVGYRKVTPTAKEIRNAYEGFAKGAMIGTTKGKNGMVITILNYEKYQDPKKYEGRDEGRGEKSTKVTDGAKPINNKKEKKDNKDIYSRVVDYLNKKTGKDFKVKTEATRRLINARLKENFTPEDFKTVIDNQCSKWLTDPDMVEYLRPSTLFGTKFESYLNSKPVNGNSENLTPEQIREKYGVC